MIFDRIISATWKLLKIPNMNSDGDVFAIVSLYLGNVDPLVPVFLLRFNQYAILFLCPRALSDMGI